MKTSEQINELSAALSKAQGKIVGALKDSSNPFFKSKYADLASCWDACREQLTANDLAVMQFTETVENGLAVTTRLAHSSGQWVESTLILHPKDDGPQAAGSCLTYGRRYALAAIVGLAQVDDDGEAAQGRKGTPETHHSPRGDLGKNIAEDQARATATQMRTVLELDIEEDFKAMKAADIHDFLRTQHDLYVAASDQMSATERRNWKALVKLASDREHAEPRMNGR